MVRDFTMAQRARRWLSPSPSPPLRHATLLVSKCQTHPYYPVCRRSRRRPAGSRPFGPRRAGPPIRCEHFRSAPLRLSHGAQLEGVTQRRSRRLLRASAVGVHVRKEHTGRVVNRNTIRFSRFYPAAHPAVSLQLFKAAKLVSCAPERLADAARRFQQVRVEARLERLYELSDATLDRARRHDAVSRPNRRWRRLTARTIASPKRAARSSSSCRRSVALSPLVSTN